VIPVKIANRGTDSVVSALINRRAKLPRDLYQSLTRDRREGACDHQRFTVATDVDVYFCDPDRRPSTCVAISCGRHGELALSTKALGSCAVAQE
jgi:hypothetical protein